MSEILGVSLDFYQTLARHRSGRGRGASLMDYLASQGLTPAPWEHQVLYEVFEFYGEAYRPDFSDSERTEFWTEFTVRLFRRLSVSGADGAARQHAEAVRKLLGPDSLALFEDTVPALEWLNRRGLRLGIVSNWQRGLAHFCRELGILNYVPNRSVRGKWSWGGMRWEAADSRFSVGAGFHPKGERIATALA